MDATFRLERGDWVRAREGLPELLVVDRIEQHQGARCVIDARQSVLVVDAIDEVRKADGRRWQRGTDGGTVTAGETGTGLVSS
jgi:hypothetical protein